MATDNLREHGLQRGSRDRENVGRLTSSPRLEVGQGVK